LKSQRPDFVLPNESALAEGHPGHKHSSNRPTNSIILCPPALLLEPSVSLEKVSPCFTRFVARLFHLAKINSRLLFYAHLLFPKPLVQVRHLF
jgi:hypothetical protein